MNNSARVFPSFGLDYATLAERNPRIVMCSMSGMGATGPEMQYVAFGSNIEASSGLVSQIGYGDGELYSTGSFYADPITGTHGTLAERLRHDRPPLDIDGPTLTVETTDFTSVDATRIAEALRDALRRPVSRPPALLDCPATEA